jgi:hypothetical protein
MHALESPSVATRIPFGEFHRRQRQLARFGWTLIMLSALTALLQLVDHRLIHDVNVWVKPTKFLFSIGVFALTGAWFCGYVRPDRLQSGPIRYTVWATIIAGSFEIAYITLQASRGLDSHFNFTSSFYNAMYSLMGVGAVVLISATLPLAWEIGRRPRAGLSRDFVTAVVLGLVLTFVLGGGFGGYMSSTSGHAVGAEHGHFPIFGWNRIGGDLRVAHFFGTHFQQVLPLVAAIVAPLPTSARWTAILASAALGTTLAVAVFVQAVHGGPFMALIPR